MYLTAHRVRSPSGQREGINVFVYGLSADVAIEWTRPDVVDLASANPGKLLLEVIEVPPAMNDVSSYLDVVAPDGLSSAQLARTIEHAASLYPAEPKLPVTWRVAPAGLKFHANPAFHPDPPSELRRLKQKLLMVLGFALSPGQQPQVAPAHNPLRVTTTPDDVGVRYMLDAESRRRLWRLRREALPLSMGVTHDGQEELRKLYGAALFYSECATALTGLSIDRINALAGIVFLGARGELLWSSTAP